MAEALKNKDLWGGVEPFRPVIDGVEFTDQPLNLFQNGRWNSEKAVLFGTNEGEMAYVSAAFEYIPNLAILGDVFEVRQQSLIINVYLACNLHILSAKTLCL